MRLNIHFFYTTPISAFKYLFLSFFFYYFCFSLQILLEAGASIDAEDNDGNTPLHIKCYELEEESSNLEIISSLIERGADILKRNKTVRMKGAAWHTVRCFVIWLVGCLPVSFLMYWNLIGWVSHTFFFFYILLQSDWLRVANRSICILLQFHWFTFTDQTVFTCV